MQAPFALVVSHTPVVGKRFWAILLPDDMTGVAGTPQKVVEGHARQCKKCRSCGAVQEKWRFDVKKCGSCGVMRAFEVATRSCLQPLSICDLGICNADMRIERHQSLHCSARPAFFAPESKGFLHHSARPAFFASCAMRHRAGRHLMQSYRLQPLLRQTRWSA